MKNKRINLKIAFSKKLLEEGHLYGECRQIAKNKYLLIINPDKNNTDRKIISTLYHEFSHFILNTYFNYVPKEMKINKEIGQLKLDRIKERICQKIEKSSMTIINKYFDKGKK